MRNLLLAIAAVLALSGAGSNPFPGTGQPMDGMLPPTGWQTPYNPNPWTTPIIPCDTCQPTATVDPNSAAQISYVMGLAGGFSLGEITERQPGGTGHGQGSPLYFASLADPVYVVTCSGNGGGYCSSTSGNTLTVHIPNGATASGATDHHLEIIDSFDYTDYLFQEFNNGCSGSGTTTPVFGGGAICASGGGYATSLSMYAAGALCTTCGGDATHMPFQPGLMDPLEIVNGQINHVIDIALYCPSSLFYWPAASSDGPCSSGPGEGERIWLNLTTGQIKALGFCSWETTILIAMHNYGLMISDTGGTPGPWDMYTVQDPTQQLWGGVGNWTLFFNWLTTSCPSANPNFSSGSSHMPLLTTGLSASDLEIVQ